MNDPAVRIASYSDVLAAPFGKIAEVIHGVGHLSPRSGGPHGAAASALIDPDALTLETYQLSEGKWGEVGAYSRADRPRAVPFEAIELELVTLWADVEPPPPEES